MIYIYFFPYNPDYITKIAMDTIGLYMNANNPEKWLFFGKRKIPTTIRSVEKIFDNRNIYACE